MKFLQEKVAGIKVQRQRDKKLKLPVATMHINGISAVYDILKTVGDSNNNEVHFNESDHDPE